MSGWGGGSISCVVCVVDYEAGMGIWYDARGFVKEYMIFFLGTAVVSSS